MGRGRAQPTRRAFKRTATHARRRGETSLAQSEPDQVREARAPRYGLRITFVCCVSKTNHNYNAQRSEKKCFEVLARENSADVLRWPLLPLPAERSPVRNTLGPNQCCITTQVKLYRESTRCIEKRCLIVVQIAPLNVCAVQGTRNGGARPLRSL